MMVILEGIETKEDLEIAQVYFEKFIRYDYEIFYVEITAIPIVYNGEPVVVQLLIREWFYLERKRLSNANIR